MGFKKTVCVIVDAYSTGKYLAPAFRGRGYECIHIKSSQSLPQIFQHSQSDFIESWELRENQIDELLEKLGKFHVKLILAGSESGVELVDALNARLHLPGNSKLLSHARRDKYKMTEQVAAAGLNTIKQHQANKVEEIISWVASLETSDWPVVLKPLSSQSGDHVFFCHDEESIQEAFIEIKSNKNLFGQENDMVLAQSFNRGQEYIVNTVSWDGQHFPVEIWRIEKLPGTIIYDFAEILPHDSPEFEILVNYTKGVLDALGISHGPGTTELKYTPEKGPVLLETTSRPMAGMPLAFCQEISGFTQISLTVEAYLTPMEFLSRFECARPIRTLHGLAAILISDTEGELEKDISVEAFGEINTLFSYTLSTNAGFSLKKTVDSLTSPGEFYLIAPDRELLLEDYRYIRQQEKRGIYHQAIKSSVLQSDWSLFYLGTWKEKLPPCSFLPAAP